MSPQLQPGIRHQFKYVVTGNKTVPALYREFEELNFSHLAATLPGMTVTVECEIIAVEGRKVRFQTCAHDGVDLISEGTHERVVIDAARFNDSVGRKRAAAAPA